MIIFLAPGLVRPRGIASRRPGCRTPTWWSWGDRLSPSPLAASRSSWWSSSAAAQRAPSSTRCCCAPTRAPPSRPRHPPRRLTSPRAPDDDVTPTGVQSGVWFYFFPLTAAWRSSAWAQSSNIQRNDSTWTRCRAPCCISKFSERRTMVDGVPKRMWAVVWFSLSIAHFLRHMVKLLKMHSEYLLSWNYPPHPALLCTICPGTCLSIVTTFF